jgi:hypothetical protein
MHSLWSMFPRKTPGYTTGLPARIESRLVRFHGTLLRRASRLHGAKSFRYWFPAGCLRGGLRRGSHPGSLTEKHLGRDEASMLSSVAAELRRKFTDLKRGTLA